MIHSPIPRFAWALGIVLCVGTSAFAQTPSSPKAADAPRPAARSAAAAPTPEPAVDTSAPVRAAPAPSAAATGQAAAPSRAGAPRARDRVELDASQITGNRELPRVLYIVPWRAPEAGDLEGRPVNSLLYELTRPLDREVFRRENRYFDTLQSVSPAPPDAARPVR